MPVGYITPEHFKDAFLSAIKARESELTSFWAKDYYSQPKVGSYTAYFLNVILRDVAEKLRLAVWPRDYYTLDAVLYQEADTVNLAIIYLNGPKQFLRGFHLQKRPATCRAFSLSPLSSWLSWPSCFWASPVANPSGLLRH